MHVIFPLHIALPHSGNLVLRVVPDEPGPLMNEALAMGIAPHPAEIRHPRRVAEYYTTAMMKLESGLTGPILYEPSGKPYLENGPHISVSHGQALAGFARCECPVGLDIQYPEEKLINIARRFCHPDELAYARALPAPLQYLTFLWSAKEALFKIYGEGLIFSAQIRVAPPDGEEGEVRASVERAGMWHDHIVSYRWINGHIVVFAQ